MTDPANEQRQREIARQFRRLARIARELERNTRWVVSLLDLVGNIMATNQEKMQQLTDELAKLQQQVTDDEAQDDANAQALLDQVAALEAALAGSSIDVQPQLDAITEIANSLHAPPTNPSTPPTP